MNWLLQLVGETPDGRYYFRIPPEIFPGNQTVYGPSADEVVEKILGLAASDVSGKWNAWLEAKRPKQSNPKPEPKEFFVYSEESRRYLTGALTQAEAEEIARQKRQGLRPGDAADIQVVRQPFG